MGPSELFLGLGILVKAEKCPHQLPGFGTHTGTGARSSQEMRCSGCIAKGAGPLPSSLTNTHQHTHMGTGASCAKLLPSPMVVAPALSQTLGAEGLGGTEPLTSGRTAGRPAG